MLDGFDEDRLMMLQDRLRAARRTLREAYERRDVLAKELGTAMDERGTAPRAYLIMALSATERANITHEVRMQDAAHACCCQSGLLRQTPSR